jgi:hypothetical protein
VLLKLQFNLPLLGYVLNDSEQAHVFPLESTIRVDKQSTPSISSGKMHLKYSHNLFVVLKHLLSETAEGIFSVFEQACQVREPGWAL